MRRTKLEQGLDWYWTTASHAVAAVSARRAKEIALKTQTALDTFSATTLLTRELMVRYSAAQERLHRLQATVPTHQRTGSSRTMEIRNTKGQVNWEDAKETVMETRIAEQD